MMYNDWSHNILCCFVSYGENWQYFSLSVDCKVRFHLRNGSTLSSAEQSVQKEPGTAAMACELLSL